MNHQKHIKHIVEYFIINYEIKPMIGFLDMSTDTIPTVFISCIVYIIQGPTLGKILGRLFTFYRRIL